MPDFARPAPERAGLRRADERRLVARSRAPHGLRAWRATSDVRRLCAQLESRPELLVIHDLRRPGDAARALGSARRGLARGRALLDRRTRAPSGSRGRCCRWRGGPLRRPAAGRALASTPATVPLPFAVSCRRRGESSGPAQAPPDRPTCWSGGVAAAPIPCYLARMDFTADEYARRDADRLREILSGPPVTWVFLGDSITQGVAHTHGRRGYVEHFAERVRGELGRRGDAVDQLRGVRGDDRGPPARVPLARRTFRS